jgi:hypothetical protein
MPTQPVRLVKTWILLKFHFDVGIPVVVTRGYYRHFIGSELWVWWGIFWAIKVIKRLVCCWEGARETLWEGWEEEQRREG